MNRSAIIFENSPWFIIVCLIVGFLFAFILYSTKGPWKKEVHYLLFGLRFLLASIMCFLLVGPIIKQIINTPEDPIIIVAIDNSSSIPKGIDSLSLNNFINNLDLEMNGLPGFQIYTRTLKSTSMPANLKALKFDQESSDITGMLSSIQSEYEGRNLAGVILISDGIYNLGISPNFKALNFNLHTIGIGDTSQRKDLSIRSAIFNKISYQGNKFPVVVDIINKGFTDRTIDVSVSKNNKILASKKINLTNAKTLEQVDFLIDANEVGMQRFKVEITSLEGEVSYENNYKQIFVDIIEGREKILLVASSPHPDIKAIKSAIESNKNYQLTQYIPRINEWSLNKLDEEKYDLVIFHQVPDLRNSLLNIYSEVFRREISTLTIVGPNTNLRQFSSSNPIASINVTRYERDMVLPSFNTAFSHFSLSNDLQNLFGELPPAAVPFGEIELAGETESLLYQRVGRVETLKPLLSVNEQFGAKHGVLFGVGTWRWRLHEYSKSESNVHYNELFTKVIQYLSSKEDKRKFKIYPVDTNQNSGNGITFETEFYNDLFERVYGPKVELKLTDEQNNTTRYSYVPSEGNSKFEINGLTEGVYKFYASTILNGENLSVGGETLVKKLALENINLTADFNLLRRVAERNNGKFVEYNDIGSLLVEISSRNHPAVLHSNESYIPLVNLKILFFVLLTLVSIEWFARKFSGAY